MTAVVSRERVKTTCLTGAAGVLMLAVALAMMVLAAPGHVPSRPDGAAMPPVVQLTTDVGHQFTSRNDPATARASAGIRRASSSG